MSDRLPYEEQLVKQMEDLPLPDENVSWEDMRRRLEEEDDDRIIPFWLRGCGLWGLLLLGCIGLGWWLFFYNKKKNTEQPFAKEEMVQQTTLPKEAPGTTTKLNPGPVVDSVIILKTKADSSIIGELPPGLTAVSRETQRIAEKGGRPGNKNRSTGKDLIDAHSQPKNTGTNSRERGAMRELTGKNIPAPAVVSDLPAAKDNGVNTNGQSSNEIFTDSVSIDFMESQPKDSVIEKKTVVAAVSDTTVKKDSAKDKTISFSAGMALYQLIPVAGQELTPYDASGRKGSLADYIPSVYLRMYKNEKWFLQAEFRYGAPQYNRELVFQEENKIDSFANTNTITSAKLKKTFYHQVPVSFNYFVLPNWSLGGGFVWNTFKGAVSEQDVVQRTISTGSDTVISKGVILTSTSADSNFAKSYFQGLLETQYRWKRFSLGARYSFGLEPYLTFTLQGQGEQKESNRSLQVFIRYELWKSKTRILKTKQK